MTSNDNEVISATKHNTNYKSTWTANTFDNGWAAEAIEPLKTLPSTRWVAVPTEIYLHAVQVLTGLG